MEAMKNTVFRYFLLCFLVLFIATGCEDDPVTTANNKATPSNSIEAEVHQLINLHRTGMGLTALEWNDIIAEQCRSHSIILANAHTINHDGFNERIIELEKLFRGAGLGKMLLITTVHRVLLQLG